MRLFDLIKRKLFNEPPSLVDCVRDKEWYERKYGKEVSKYMKWEEDGQKKPEGTLKDGELDGLVTEWYENGEKSSKTYKDGELDGLVTEWYENGQKKFEGSFKDGEKDGLFTWWYGNGKKEYEGTYKNGKKISVKEWNEDGSVKE